MGPLVTGAARDKVSGLIETGVNEGAKLVLDGRGVRVEDHDEGFYVGPTLFDEVKTHMEVYKQEIFGPVLIVLRVADIDEAIGMINDNPYGNGTTHLHRQRGRRPQVPERGPGWHDRGQHPHPGADGLLLLRRLEGLPLWRPARPRAGRRRLLHLAKVVTTRWPVPRDSAVELGFPTSR